VITISPPHRRSYKKYRQLVITISPPHRRSYKETYLQDCKSRYLKSITRNNSPPELCQFTPTKSTRTHLFNRRTKSWRSDTLSPLGTLNNTVRRNDRATRLTIDHQHTPQSRKTSLRYHTQSSVNPSHHQRSFLSNLKMLDNRCMIMNPRFIVMTNELRFKTLAPIKR